MWPPSPIRTNGQSTFATTERTAGPDAGRPAHEPQGGSPWRPRSTAVGHQLSPADLDRQFTSQLTFTGR